MNYLKEINSFYMYLEIKTLSPMAISLWHALMHINNRSRWRKQFTVSMQVLHEKTGYERKTLMKARQQLTELGLIKWERRGNNQAACYQMIPFGENFMSNYEEYFRDYDEDSGDSKIQIPDSNNSTFQIPDSKDSGDSKSQIPDSDDSNDADVDEEGNTQQLNLFGDDQEPRADTFHVPPEGHCSEQPDAQPDERRQEQLDEQQHAQLNGQPGAQPGGLINKHDTLEGKPLKDSKENNSRPLKVSPNRILMLYRQYCPNLIQVKLLDKSRRKAIITQCNHFGINNTMKMLKMAGQSKFLAGENDKGWKAGIDWLMKPANFMKVLDGNYDDKPDSNTTSTGKSQPTDFRFKPSSIELLEEAYKSIVTDEIYSDNAN